MKSWTGNYVIHECKKCGCAFVAEDYTRATALPPKWRYCEECASKMKLNYAEQTPKNSRTEEEQKIIQERMLRLMNARTNKK